MPKLQNTICTRARVAPAETAGGWGDTPVALWITEKQKYSPLPLRAAGRGPTAEWISGHVPNEHVIFLLQFPFLMCRVIQTSEETSQNTARLAGRLQIRQAIILETITSREYLTSN
ncbi:hypothetical protein CgunFtcFv8_004599 [Champsocephalus gunnari]|uniref:Uncharacterized protein n=1 Tax=Champsocephalus gunnari TaxID=52237 RepID=A0AAN8E1H6_CHAGU|nr:hypothetical protein CgunFtcFv8_004599 [Champsocephalus gunnari]